MEEKKRSAVMMTIKIWIVMQDTVVKTLVPDQ